MELSVGTMLHGFTVESVETLPEIEGSAYVMRHERSKARLLYLKNEDPNKAFAIGFKTAPVDDTGVFHILEHSVLNGSDKFPVKEPFVTLLKNSMQTFLNAMTFPDKTLYPVASTNEQDLLNLMDVYLDAVMHPAIYYKPEIFQQEGWHFEIEGDAVTCNGVVFNEMKGALSSPESVLYDALSAALFPDTAYRFESGGTPEAIPELTYEGFLDTHSRHYRLDNSYITLYGNLDADKFLAFLDERYLTPCATLRADADAPNPLEEQQPVTNFGRTCEMVTAKENAALAYGYVVGHAIDRDRQIAAEILLDAIAGSNEAPLKRALLDADLAADVNAFLADGLLQPFVAVEAKGIHENASQRFPEVFEKTVRELADGALDHKLVEAALSHAEFVLRERNFGMSDGVAYAMASLSGWLYDDSAATLHLRFEDAFAKLRTQLEEGYFEQLLRELFLENDHAASVELVPVEKDEDNRLDKMLAEKTATLTAEEKSAIAEQVEVLRAAQEAQDTPEQLATLPHLGIADLGEAPVDAAYELQQHAGLKVLRHQEPTHGIAYAYRYFSLDALTWEELPYAHLLALVLGKLDTERHTAADLDTEIQSKLGNLAFLTEVHESAKEPSSCKPMLTMSASALESKVQWLAALPEEIMGATLFGDAGKIHDVLEQTKVHMEQVFINRGNTCAMQRATSYFSPAALAREKMGGIEGYRFICDLLENWDEQAPTIPGKLSEIAGKLFRDSNCMVSFGGSDEALAAFLDAHQPLDGAQPEKALSIPAPQQKNEAFIIPSDITYSALSGSLAKEGSAYNGTWLLAMRALSYDYLWNEVRVKGGAYGAGFSCTRTNNARFYSYRDPKLDQTIQRFRDSAGWLAGFAPDADELEGYVVSTVAGMDSPEKAREAIRRQTGWHLCGLSPDCRLVTRQEVIGSSLEDVRALGSTLKGVCDQRNMCVFGNKQIIEQSELGLDVITLIG